MPFTRQPGEPRTEELTIPLQTPRYLQNQQPARPEELTFIGPDIGDISEVGSDYGDDDLSRTDLPDYQSSSSDGSYDASDDSNSLCVGFDEYEYDECLEVLGPTFYGPYGPPPPYLPSPDLGPWSFQPSHPPPLGSSVLEKLVL